MQSYEKYPINICNTTLITLHELFSQPFTGDFILLLPVLYSTTINADHVLALLYGE